MPLCPSGTVKRRDADAVTAVLRLIKAERRM